MSSASTERSAGDGGQYKEAIATYRATARWVLSTAGAAAAALVAGAVPLSSLGALVWWRVLSSTACILIALVAAGWIMRAGIDLLAPERGTYKDFDRPLFKPLRDDLKREPSPLSPWATSAEGLAKLYDAALDAEKATYLEFVRRREERRAAATGSNAQGKKPATARSADEPTKASEPAPDGAQHPEDRVLVERYEHAHKRRMELKEPITRVVWLGLVLNAEAKFKAFMKTVYICGFITAAAAIGFSILANPPAKPTPTPTPTPLAKTQVHVSVSEPKTCADLYLTLDELAHRVPRIASHWPAASLGEQAKKCGFADKQQLSSFLSFLASER